MTEEDGKLPLRCLADFPSSPETGLFQETTMFSHIMLGVNDLESSKRFYDALLGQLGIAPGVANKNRFFYRSPTGVFAISTPINGESASSFWPIRSMVSSVCEIGACTSASPDTSIVAPSST